MIVASDLVQRPSLMIGSHRSITVPLALAAIALAGAGCGGANAGQRVVARVGGLAITQSMVTHWMTVLGLQPTGSGLSSEALLRVTLGYLISSDWLLGEAAAEGVPVPASEVSRRREIATELASSNIRRRALAAETAPRMSELVAYYRNNMENFEHPAGRRFYIVEKLETKHEARALMREIVAGKQRIARLHHHVTYLEEWNRPEDLGNASPILQAIFAAKPGAVTGPIGFGQGYILIEVVKVMPAHVQTVAQARAELVQAVQTLRRRHTLAGVAEQLRARWVARTTCSPGYVVQQCHEYKGASSPEEWMKLE